MVEKSVIICLLFIFHILFSSYSNGFEGYPTIVMSDLNSLEIIPFQITMKAGQSFQIIIKPLKNKIARCRWIYSYSYTDYKDIKFYKHPTKIIYDVSDIIEAPRTAGNWIYECIFYDLYSDCNHFVDRTCHVLPSSKDEGIIRLNRVYIYNSTDVQNQFNLTVNYETFYKGDIYKFFDGEGANFTCYKTKGHIQLKYISQERYISTGYSSGSVSMYQRLTAANDGDTIECDDGQSQITLKLYFNRDTRETSTFSVNGLPLPRAMEYDNNYYYEYRCYSGEPIKVAMTGGWHGMETCRLGSKYPRILNLYYGSNFTLNDLNSFDVSDGLILICSMKYLDAILIIVPQTPTYYPYITGLSNSKVLLQYPNYSENTYNIEYWIENNPLSLFCSSEEGYNYGWTSNNEVKQVTKKDSLTLFELLPGRDKATVQCREESTKVTYLTLFRRSDVKIPNVQATSLTTLAPALYKPLITTSTTQPIIYPPNKLTPRTTVPSSPNTTPRIRSAIRVDTSSSSTSPATNSTVLEETTTTSPSEIIKTSPQPESSEPDHRVIVIVVMLVLVTLIALGLWMWYNYKKKQLLIKNTSNTDYQNLPEHREGPMTIPQQWNRADNVYAEPNTISNNLYAKPVPKSKRTKEPTYAEPRDSIRNPTYINTNRINNESNYATVQNDDPAYAAVQNNDPAYAAVQNNDPAYATVQNKEPTYAAVQKNDSNHKSVQNNGVTYANQNIIMYQNLDHLTRGNKKASGVGNSSKDLDNNTNAKNNEHKFDSQNIQKKNFSDVEYANLMLATKDEDFNPTTMPAYSKIDHKQPKKLLVNQNGGYINADVNNDIEPAYCEVMKPGK